MFLKSGQTNGTQVVVLSSLSFSAGCICKENKQDSLPSSSVVLASTNGTPFSKAESLSSVPCLHSLCFVFIATTSRNSSNDCGLCTVLLVAITIIIMTGLSIMVIGFFSLAGQRRRRPFKNVQLGLDHLNSFFFFCFFGMLFSSHRGCLGLDRQLIFLAILQCGSTGMPTMLDR